MLLNVLLTIRNKDNLHSRLSELQAIENFVTFFSGAYYGKDTAALIIENRSYCRSRDWACFRSSHGEFSLSFPGQSRYLYFFNLVLLARLAAAEWNGEVKLVESPESCHVEEHLCRLWNAATGSVVADVLFAGQPFDLKILNDTSRSVFEESLQVQLELVGRCEAGPENVNENEAIHISMSDVSWHAQRTCGSWKAAISLRNNSCEKMEVQIMNVPNEVDEAPPVETVAMELVLGRIEISYKEFISLRPGSVIEVEAPQKFESAIKINGTEWAPCELQFCDGGISLKILSFSAIPQSHIQQEAHRT